MDADKTNENAEGAYAQSQTNYLPMRWNRLLISDMRNENSPNVSPSILSWGLIPMSLVHLASSAVLLLDSHHHASSSPLWPAIFYPGGFIIVFIVGMLIVIRRGEHTSYQFADKIALAIEGIAIITFVAICLAIKHGTTTG